MLPAWGTEIHHVICWMPAESAGQADRYGGWLEACCVLEAMFLSKQVVQGGWIPYRVAYPATAAPFTPIHSGWSRGFWLRRVASREGLAEPVSIALTNRVMAQSRPLTSCVKSGVLKHAANPVLGSSYSEVAAHEPRNK